MKFHIIAIISAFLITSCASEDAGNTVPDSRQASVVSLSEEDVRTARFLEFQDEMLVILRTETDSSFFVRETEVWTSDTTGGKPPIISYLSLGFNVDQDQAVSLMMSVMDQLDEHGYKIYRAEENFGYAPDVLAVIKTEDQFDIIRTEGTCGPNYGLTLAQVEAKLQEWNQRYPFEIVGAGPDWVQAAFSDDVPDFVGLAEEVYAFCPDVVDQGSGSVEGLAAEMQDSNSLYLWWD